MEGCFYCGFMYGTYLIWLGNLGAQTFCSSAHFWGVSDFFLYLFININLFSAFESRTMTCLFPAEHILQMNTMQGINCLWIKSALKYGFYCHVFLCQETDPFNSCGIGFYFMCWLALQMYLRWRYRHLAVTCSYLFFEVLTGASRQLLILNIWNKLQLWIEGRGVRYRVFTYPKTTFKIVSQLLFWRELYKVAS